MVYAFLSPRIRLVLAFLLIFICGNAEATVFQELDSLRAGKWKQYNQAGQYDSVIVSARSLLDRAIYSGDQEAALMSSVMIAQAYLFTERTDSARYWIEKTESMGVESGSLSVQSVFYNTKAIYAVKFQLDYSEALKYFLRGYEAATVLGNQDYRVTLLTNIANVFYLRSDEGGMRYAQEALLIVDSCQVSDFSECLSYLAASQMYYVERDYKSSVNFLGRADSLRACGGYASLTAAVELLHGDICSISGDYAQAEKHYRVALVHSYNTEPGTISRIYLNYGKCCEFMNKIDLAVSLYEHGLEVSKNHNNMEFRRELLQRLTDIYYERGPVEVFKEYYSQLRHSLDAVAGRERDFNSLLLSNQEMRHELELSANELELMEARRRNMLWFFISLTALLLVASFFFLWRRQKRMYRVLVNQYVHHARQVEMLQAGSSAEEEKNLAGRQLFRKVDILMSRDKVYRQKDLTLDRLAEMVESNRTYVSKAINSYAGQSFSSYLNMYRIAEATRLLSRQDEEIPLKQIADKVGYVSMSVFYNAFCKETGLPPGRYRKELLNRKTVPDS